MEVNQNLIVYFQNSIESLKRQFSIQIGSLQQHIVSMGLLILFEILHRFHFLVDRSEAKYLLAEFGVHDRYNIESSRVSRDITKIIVVSTTKTKQID